MFRMILLALAMAAAGFAQGTIDVVIPSGQSLSQAVAIRPAGRDGFCTLAAIVMPSAWTAADITFQASIDGTTFGNLYDDFGSEVVVRAAASRVIVVPGSYFWGIRWLRVRSGTSTTPVNQSAQRTLTLVCRE